MKNKILILVFTLFFSSLFASPFNEKLTEDELNTLSTGQVLIKNINNKKNICLKENLFSSADELLTIMDDLNPKYLAEIIQIKPYEGNEDLPKKLETILNNIPEYAGIPYYSERHEHWYDLYDSAEITETFIENNVQTIKATLKMQPFDTVYETITLTSDENTVFYTAQNENKLRYLDKFDCIWPQKMKICILLFKDGDNWILYGIGGVNAPRIPFFTERIQTSFINRINTFCSFIFDKL